MFSVLGSFAFVVVIVPQSGNVAEVSGAWPSNGKEKHAKVSYIWDVLLQVSAFVDKP